MYAASANSGIRRPSQFDTAGRITVHAIEQSAPCFLPVPTNNRDSSSRRSVEAWSSFLQYSCPQADLLVVRTNPECSCANRYQGHHTMNSKSLNPNTSMAVVLERRLLQTIRGARFRFRGLGFRALWLLALRDFPNFLNIGKVAHPARRKL